jgi:hypothetical protein
MSTRVFRFTIEVFWVDDKKYSDDLIETIDLYDELEVMIKIVRPDLDDLEFITFVSLLMYPQNHIVQGHTHIFLNQIFYPIFLMPNPFVISILILITTLATTPTIANTNLNTPNKTTTIVGSNLQEIVVLFLMRG